MIRVPLSVVRVPTSVILGAIIGEARENQEEEEEEEERDKNPSIPLLFFSRVVSIPLSPSKNKRNYVKIGI